MHPLLALCATPREGRPSAFWGWWAASATVGTPALPVRGGIVEAVVPVDAEDAGCEHEAAQKLVERERVRVAGNVPGLDRRLHHTQSLLPVSLGGYLPGMPSSVVATL